MRWLSRFPPITKLTILIQILTPPGLIVSHSLICSDNAVMKIMKMTGRWRLPTLLCSCNILKLKLFPLANLHPSHWVWELKGPPKLVIYVLDFKEKLVFLQQIFGILLFGLNFGWKLAFSMLFHVFAFICNFPQSRPWRVWSCDSPIVSRLWWRPPEQTAAPLIVFLFSVQC